MTYKIHAYHLTGEGYRSWIELRENGIRVAEFIASKCAHDFATAQREAEEMVADLRMEFSMEPL